MPSGLHGSETQGIRVRLAKQTTEGLPRQGSRLRSPTRTEGCMRVNLMHFQDVITRRCLSIQGLVAPAAGKPAPTTSP